MLRIPALWAGILAAFDHEHGAERHGPRDATGLDLRSGLGRARAPDDSSGRLTYAAGSSRYVSSAWAGPALGAAVMNDGSGTGTCFGNVNDPPELTACSVQITGPVTWFARP